MTTNNIPRSSVAREDRAWRASKMEFLHRAPPCQVRRVLAAARGVEMFLASAWLGEVFTAASSSQAERERVIARFRALLTVYRHGDPWALAARAVGEREVADA